MRGGGGFRGGGGGGGGFRGGGGGGRRSDIALKHDIVQLGTLPNGLGYYRFSYLGSSKPYVGVIAQQVQGLVPEAVTRGHDGYLRVYYKRLGLTFRSYADWLASGARIPAPSEVLP
jgi:endosialidase-like protein